MALPGGRRDPQDADLGVTAAREAREEVGLLLDEPIGRLEDHGGRLRGGVVANYVFALDTPAQLAEFSIIRDTDAAADGAVFVTYF